MKERTDEEIRAKVHELWPDAEFGTAWGSKYFEVVRLDGYIDLTVSKMYDRDDVKLSFDKLNALAEFFDTMKVETEEEISEGGCETCDYGSRYGFTLRVSNGTPFVRLSATA